MSTILTLITFFVCFFPHVYQFNIKLLITTVKATYIHSVLIQCIYYFGKDIIV